MSDFAAARRIVAGLPAAELVAARPQTFAVAPYVGRYGWVRVRLPDVDETELRELLVEAWRRTAPKRLIAAYDAAADRDSTA